MERNNESSSFFGRNAHKKATGLGLGEPGTSLIVCQPAEDEWFVSPSLR